MTRADKISGEVSASLKNGVARATNVHIGGVRHLEAVVVSLRGAGHMLGYGRKKIYQLIAEGHLVSFKDKKARRITVASIHEHINRCMAASADSKPKRPA